MHCVVPENIPHSPTKGIGNSQGEWGGGGDVKVTYWRAGNVVGQEKRRDYIVLDM